MKVTVLMEDTSNSDILEKEHGLSLYIETNKHNILFDVGASGKFINNAKKLNIDISKVDTVVISHGHQDHGGGLKEFLKINKTADIYLSKNAFSGLYSKKPGSEAKYIGLDTDLLPNGSFKFVGDYLCIDDELQIFSNIKRNILTPPCDNLMRKLEDSFIRDNFNHEQNLIISQNNEKTLVAGCAHNGIVNIIGHVLYDIERGPLNYVIGGFHLFDLSPKINEDKLFIDKIGNYLDKFDIKYFTCHCTGLGPYDELKEILGDKIRYISTGDILTF